MGSRLSGKRAFITAAGSGIGEAIARRFVAEGAEVIVTDVDGAMASAVADSLAGNGGTAQAYELDVCDQLAVERLASTVADENGALDVLVSNAGGTLAQYPRVLDADLEYWDQMMTFNLRSTFVICRTFVPRMRSGGSVITLASLGGLIHRTGFGVYGTTKAAVIQLTKAIASDHAVDNIRANTICPGMIETRAISRLLTRSGDADGERRKQASTVPLARLGQPDDIANLAAFLASDESSYITGTVQVVDGGSYTTQR